MSAAKHCTAKGDKSSGHISKKVLESSVSIAQDIRTQVICAASPAHSKEAVSWQDVLVMVAQRVEDHKDSLESTAKLWQEKTGSQEDGIDALGVKAILKELVPQLPKEELKYLITHIYLVGLDRDGLLTLEEIATCLKSRVKTEELHEEPSWDANPPCIASATKCFRALMEGPAGAQPPPIQELASQSSFFDAPRGSVCSTAFTSATTATVASSATCGVFSLDDAFHVLDAYISEHHVRCRQLFQQYDHHGSGALCTQAIERLVRRILIRASAHQLAYVMDMMCVEGPLK
eukprot:gene10778-12751_t